MAEEPKRVEIVGNVSISTDPKRTIGDYEQEQKEARERHEMFQQQHQLILRSFHMNRIAVAAALIAAIAACISAYYARQGSLTPNKSCCTQQQKQQIEHPTTAKEPAKK